jgi:hypothetical protein
MLIMALDHIDGLPLQTTKDEQNKHPYPRRHNHTCNRHTDWFHFTRRI